MCFDNPDTQKLTADSEGLIGLTGRGRKGAGFDLLKKPNEPDPNAKQNNTGLIKAAGIAGLFGEASAEYLAGKDAQDIADQNAQLLKAQAKRSLVRGTVAAQKLRRQGNQLVGSQRAAAAAQGIDVESGSAAELQTDTIRATEEDAGRIRENALLEAQGFKMQADFAKINGKQLRNAGTTRAISTLIGGFSQKGLFG